MLVNKRKNQGRVNQIILEMKKARISKKITRYKLARDIGLSDSSIANIEELRQNPTLSTIIEMAISLNFDLPQALKDNFPDSANQIEDETLTLSPTFQLVLVGLKKVNEKKLRFIYKMVRALNEE